MTSAVPGQCMIELKHALHMIYFKGKNYLYFSNMR